MYYITEEIAENIAGRIEMLQEKENIYTTDGKISLDAIKKVVMEVVDPAIESIYGEVEYVNEYNN